MTAMRAKLADVGAKVQLLDQHSAQIMTVNERLDAFESSSSKLINASAQKSIRPGRQHGV